MKVKEESEKVFLKLNIQKIKIMASGPIISWQIGGDIMETVRDFIWGGFKITADGDCSHEKHGFSSRHVWMWELDYKEYWAPKNWCFWTVVLEKTFESPLDCKEIQPVHPKDWSCETCRRNGLKETSDIQLEALGNHSDLGMNYFQACSPASTYSSSWLN